MRFPLDSLRIRSVQRATERPRPRTVALQLLACTLAAMIAFPAGAFADDAKCVAALNKNAGKLAKAWAKHVQACLKDFSPHADAEDCIQFGGGAKIAKAHAKLLDQGVGGLKDKCDGMTPSVGYLDPFLVGEAQGGMVVDLAHRLFGDPVDSTDPGDDPELQKCRASVWKSASKLLLLAQKETSTCVSKALKVSNDSPLAIAEACFVAPSILEPEGKWQTKAQKIVEKLSKRGCDDEALGAALAATSGFAPETPSATAIEYGLIAALIAIAIIAAATLLGQQLTTTYAQVAEDLDGRQAGYWAGLYREDFADDRAINGSHLFGFSADVFEANTGQSSRACAQQGISCHLLGDGPIGSTSVGTGRITGGPSPDAYFASDGGDFVCVNNNDTTFTCGTPETAAPAGGNVALGSFAFDGDRDNDVIKAHSSGTFYCENVDGAFPSCSQIGTETADARGVALADFDGDSTLDVAIATDGAPDRVCRVVDPGTGPEWSCADISPTVTNARAVALGDFNKDRAVDAAFATTGGGGRVCLNVGDGSSFSCTDLLATAPGSPTTDAVDVTVIGRLHRAKDLVFAHAGPTSRICLNDGDGSFACEPLVTGTGVSTSVAAGDLDGSGRQDVLFGVQSGPNRRCLRSNSDLTSYTCSDYDPTTTDTSDVALVGRFVEPFPPPIPSGF